MSRLLHVFVKVAKCVCKMANGGGGGGHNSVKEHLSAWETRNGFFTSCILSTTLPLVFVGEISLSRMHLNDNKLDIYLNCYKWLV